MLLPSYLILNLVNPTTSKFILLLDFQDQLIWWDNSLDIPKMFQIFLNDRNLRHKTVNYIVIFSSRRTYSVCLLFFYLFIAFLFVYCFFICLLFFIYCGLFYLNNNKWFIYVSCALQFVLECPKNCVQVFGFHVWLNSEILLPKCDNTIGEKNQYQCFIK